MSSGPALTCTSCGLINPPASVRWDCGYNFSTGRIDGQAANDPDGVLSAGRAYKPPRSRGKMAIAALVAFCLVSLVSIGSTAMQNELLDRIAAGQVISDDEIDSSDNRQQLVGLLGLATFIAAAVSLLSWQFRVSSNLSSLGAANQRFSPRWAVGWWFVPIMNVFRPYQVMAEIWRASDPSVARDTVRWKASKAAALLGWWWALWLIGTYIGRISGKLFASGDTAEDLILANQIGTVSILISIVVAVLAIFLVSRITDRQEEKRRINTGAAVQTESKTPG